jgi:hypothetical protein
MHLIPTAVNGSSPCALRLRTAGGIGSALAIVKLLDPDARTLHQYLRQRRGDFASVESLQSFEMGTIEQQAHLPTGYRRREVARLHRLPPERVVDRSEKLSEGARSDQHQQLRWFQQRAARSTRGMPTVVLAHTTRSNIHPSHAQKNAGLM